MKLRDLLSAIQVRSVHGSIEFEIRDVVYDSRQVQTAGTLFVAIPGVRTDGISFISEAIKRGAAAVVRGATKSGMPLGTGEVTEVEVADPRQALAELSARFYSHPSRALKVIGITGTNGKTTSSFIARHICESAGLPCGLFGTINYQLGNGTVLPSARTTPESADLQRLLAMVRDTGGKAASMEVSSHAITNRRILGLELDAAVFTNLSQDHLDFHGRMSDYFDAKASLFTGHLARQTSKRGTAIINIDDSHGSILAGRIGKSVPTITFGQNVRASFRASNINATVKGTTFQLAAHDRSYLVKLPLIGQFNVYNALAAVAACSAIGVPVRACVEALGSAPPVPGRLQAVPTALGFQVFVDYAHTDDALRNVLLALRELKPRRLVVVFGCGGDRDKLKRPLMAKAVESHADFAVVTSDNPRSEDPAEIIDDVVAGFKTKRFEVIVDRRQAIEFAIGNAEPGDLLLIAGKGHENYQELRNGTIPFDDIEVARGALAAKSAQLR